MNTQGCNGSRGGGDSINKEFQNQFIGAYKNKEERTSKLVGDYINLYTEVL